MIRSTKTTTKYSNTNKISSINNLQLEYQKLLKTFIDYLWNIKDII